MARAAEAKGKLRIGDDWNAIRIIALSQSNPLKAIAELVENSIDAQELSPHCSHAVSFDVSEKISEPVKSVGAGFLGL